MTEFTPFTSLFGGAMIGLAAVLLMLANGRVAGISGIAGRLLPPFEDGETAARLAFVGGLVAAPLVYMLLGGNVTQTVSSSIPLMAAAGLLVGFGSVYGGGCTSGHGVCGLSRLSQRSLIATVTFMGVAMITVLVVRHVL
jgi:uncharacterized membrane protein YedE/YeeE